MRRPASGSVVIPVYNRAGTLSELIERLDAVMESEFARFEIVLVNDGSDDESWQVIEDLSRKYSSVRGLNLARNYGQHNALLAGIRDTHFDAIITMDDDLQNPPEEIPKLVREFSRGFDLVYGVPDRQVRGPMRRFGTRLAKAAIGKATGDREIRRLSAFRIFDSAAKDAFREFRGPFVSIDVLLSWGTGRRTAIEVSHQSNRDASSGYNFRKLLIHALDTFTGFSTLPLRFATFIGFAFTLFGFGILAFVLARLAIEGESVPGFPFLASIIAIFSGAQLAAIGIIGEYLARIHFRSMERPAYVVRERSD